MEGYVIHCALVLGFASKCFVQIGGHGGLLRTVWLSEDSLVSPGVDTVILRLLTGLNNRLQELWLRSLVVGPVVGCSLRPRYFLVDMPACLLVFLPGGEFPEQWARRKLEELSITTSDKDSSKEES